MLKVLTLVGTRPEIIKLSRIIAELDRHVAQTIVHTGQNFDYELNGIFFDQLGIRRPDIHLEAAGASAAETIGQVIQRLDPVIEQTSPDAVVLLGDTNSCLGVIAAKRRKVPIFHLEAGNRCFDPRVPEEINRRIVDHTSDVNLVYTEHARRNLLAEGLRSDLILKTGSPMAEVIAYHREAIARSEVLGTLGLERRGFILVSAHREENVDDPRRLREWVAAIAELGEAFGVEVVVSTHPRTRRRLEALGEGLVAARVRFMKPLGFVDYVRLQTEALCVVSDSGTVTEEASILGFPAVTIRETHERPEGMDEGTLVMCPPVRGRLRDAVGVVVAQHADGDRRRLVADYDAPAVSMKVVRIVLSYVAYVRRVVWGETYVATPPL